MKTKRHRAVQQPEPFTPGVTSGMVRQRAFELFRDKLPDRPLTLEDWVLAQSPHVAQMWCAPGNAGIAEERLAKNNSAVDCVPIGAEDLPGLLAFAQEKKPDLTVVGPDNPLALGVVDLFQQNGLRIWG